MEEPKTHFMGAWTEEYKKKIMELKANPPERVDSNLEESSDETTIEHKKNLAAMFEYYVNVMLIDLSGFSTYMIAEDCSAEMNLQYLVNNAIYRIYCSHRTAIGSKSENNDDTYMIIKWGCSTPHQNLYGQEIGQGEYFYCLSMVLIELYSIKQNGDKTTLWQNETPTTTHNCQPIKFIYSTRAPETISEEMNAIKRLISELVPIELKMLGKLIKVKTKLILCKEDKKVCHASTTYTTTQNCFICGATPRTMNNLNSFNANDIDYSTLPFAISIPHAYIRFMECILEIAYRLEIKQWEISSDQERTIHERKSEILNRIKERTALSLDTLSKISEKIIYAYTARSFFKEATEIADITGVDERLIMRFRIILESLKSDFRINKETFRQYITETANLYVELYPWYNMPFTVHTILYHGCEIIDNSLLAFGQMADKALEEKHTINFNYIGSNKYNISKKDINADLMFSLMLAADPHLNIWNRILKIPSRHLPKEVLPLLRINHPFLNLENSNANDGNDDQNNEAEYESTGSSEYE